MNYTVAIVGAGLSGLLTAHRLKQAGISICIIEARDRIGGRIYTKKSRNDTPVEMGATWFGDYHKNLIKLIKELKLPVFEQYMGKTVYFQSSADTSPEVVELPPQPPSYRIGGGTQQLINTLGQHFEAEELFLGHTVNEINVEDSWVEIHTDKSRLIADRVICCIPPALVVNTIRFKPALPSEVIGISKTTHTWMKDSIKIALVFDQPFWRLTGFSGSFFSNGGPVVELYDHCDIETSRYALCGFLRQDLHHLSRSEREQLIVAQLVSVFGEQIKHYLAYEEMVWANEKFTSPTVEDELFPHQNNGHIIFNQPLFHDRVILSCAETSPVNGGYMDGAVFAANEATKKIKATLSMT